jgi:hypothetical protein
LLSAFLTATLTQSAISLSLKSAVVVSPPGSSTVSRASEYFLPRASGSEFRDEVLETIRLRNAIKYGLVMNTADKFELDSPRCSTSNCRFPKVDSLGICTQYWNVTDLLEVSESVPNKSDSDSFADNYWFAKLPNGVSSTFDGANASVTMYRSDYSDDDDDDALQPLWPSQSSQDNSTDKVLPLASFSIIWNNHGLREDNSKYSRVGAIEILLHFCVRRYDFTFKDNIATRTLLNTSFDLAFPSDDGSSQERSKPVGLIAPGNSSEIMQVGDELVYQMKTVLGVEFERGEYYVMALAEADLKMLQDQPLEQRYFEALRNMTDNLAASLSNR